MTGSFPVEQESLGVGQAGWRHTVDNQLESTVEVDSPAQVQGHRIGGRVIVRRGDRHVVTMWVNQLILVHVLGANRVECLVEVQDKGSLSSWPC